MLGNSLYLYIENQKQKKLNFVKVLLTKILEARFYLKWLIFK